MTGRSYQSVRLPNFRNRVTNIYDIFGIGGVCSNSCQKKFVLVDTGQ
jgi:hypothetical protein